MEDLRRQERHISPKSKQRLPSQLKRSLAAVLGLALVAAAGLFVSGAVYPQSVHAVGANTTDFVTTWETTTSNESITIPTNSLSYTYDYNVSWGDGNTSSNVTGDATHTYATAGSHQVRISGTFPAISLGGTGNTAANAAKLSSIDQWGNNQWKSMSFAFYQASNLTNNATDTPDLSNVTDMGDMFNGTAFNGDLSSWDVSNVTDMGDMFFDDTAFNGDISNWDVSNVTSMFQMFSDTAFNGDISNWDVSHVLYMGDMFNGTAFNGDLSSWDVSNVTDMRDMFYRATAFNGDLSSWDVSNVTNMEAMFAFDTAFNSDLSNWNVSRVTDMAAMFGFSAFNGDLSSWDVSSATDMSDMFYGTTFNGDLSNWNISNVTNISDMLSNSGLSQSNYEAALIGWAKENVQPGLALGAIGLTYCSQAAQDARTILTSSPDNWTVTGDSKNCAVQGNRAPTAENGTLTTTEGHSATGELKSTDPDAGNTATYYLVSQPSHGTVTINLDGSYTYTPDKGYVGSDSFTFKAKDAQAYSATAATVAITVKQSVGNSANSTAKAPDTGYGQPTRSNPLVTALITGVIISTGVGLTLLYLQKSRTN